MVLSIDHIQLNVSDVEKFVELFEKLGFQVVARPSHHGGAAEVQLPGPNQPVFDLIKAGSGEDIGDFIGLNHIAFQVTSVPEACDELKARGINIESGPYLASASGRTLANFLDPDGGHLQLTEVERKVAQG